MADPIDSGQRVRQQFSIAYQVCVETFNALEQFGVPGPSHADDVVPVFHEGGRNRVSDETASAGD